MKEELIFERIENLEKELKDLKHSINKRGLYNYLKKSLNKMNVLIGIVIAFLSTSLLLYAAQRLFTEGDLIVAEDVNANFSELYSKTGSNTARINSNETAAEENATAIEDNAIAIELAVPVGTIIPFAGISDKIPEGWKLCDGSGLDVSEFSELFDVIGYHWGGTGGIFNLPDLRGIFLRGANFGRSDGYADPYFISREGYHAVDNPEGIGSMQMDAFQAHWHDIVSVSSTNYQFHRDDGDTEDVNELDTKDDDKIYLSELASYLEARGILSASGYGTARYSSETRAKNAAVHFIIKY